jgi:hypothetical protein
MAEIRIQEKKRPVWPWILLILIIIIAAVLLYMYLNRENNNNEYENTAPADTTQYYRSDTLDQGADLNTMPQDDVEQFNSFTTEDTTGNFNKEFVANGMTMLAGAIYSTVTREDTARNSIQTDTDSLMSYTQNLTDTTDRVFSRELKKSMNTAYEIMSTVQKKNYPDLNDEIKELQSAVRSVDASKPVEAQERPIRNFFRYSGSILSTMKNTAKAI